MVSVENRISASQTLEIQEYFQYNLYSIISNLFPTLLCSIWYKKWQCCDLDQLVGDILN